MENIFIYFMNSICWDMIVKKNVSSVFQLTFTVSVLGLELPEDQGILLGSCALPHCLEYENK